MRKQDALVIFTPAFPKDEQDEYWLPWLQAFVKAVNRNSPGLKIIVFAFQAPASRKEYDWYGNKIFAFDGFYKKRFARLMMWFQILQQVGRIQKTYNIKGIFSMWCHECAFVAKKAATKYQVKHYCWLLGGDAKRSNTYVKKIKPTGNELLAASDFLKDEFYSNHGIMPAHVIYHGTDAGLFAANSMLRDIDILGAGNLHASKQYDIFVEVIAQVKKQRPDVKVVLCGDGEERAKIEQMIANLGLTANIEMTGQAKHASVLQYMTRSKILLHTSAYEGFGTVCTEALHAGAYVISFCKPIYKPVEHWYNVADKEEMVNMLISLLSADKRDHKRVVVQNIDNTAQEVIKLFGHI